MNISQKLLFYKTRGNIGKNDTETDFFSSEIQRILRIPSSVVRVYSGQEQHWKLSMEGRLIMLLKN